MATFSERYSLRVPLGESAVGSVWTALDTESGAQVAILRLEPDVTDATRDRFRDHARRLMTVAHPNVVRAIAHGDTDDGVPYLVVELLEGESLAARWSHAPLTIERAVDIVRGAAEGLGALHTAGISHGDIEPGNIFLVGAKGHEVAKLIGIALNRSSVRGRVLGEPRTSLMTLQHAYAYAAPEQLKGEVPDSPSADLYSLGAVLYAALAGRPPHVAPDIDGLIEAVLHTRPAKLASLDRELSSYSATLERALGAEPSKRFQDAVSFARALKVCLAMGRSTAATEIAAGARSPVGQAPATSQIKSGVAIKKPPSAGFAPPKPRVATSAAATTPAFVVPKPEAEAPVGATEVGVAEVSAAEVSAAEVAAPATAAEDSAAGAALGSSEAPVSAEEASDILAPRMSSEELDMSDASEVPPSPPPAAGAAKPPPPPPPAPSAVVAPEVPGDVHEGAHAHGDGDAHGDGQKVEQAVEGRRPGWIVPAAIGAVVLLALGGWAVFGGSGDPGDVGAVPAPAAPSAEIEDAPEPIPATDDIVDAGVEVEIVAQEPPVAPAPPVVPVVTAAVTPPRRPAAVITPPRPAVRPTEAAARPRTKRPRTAQPTVARDPGF